MQLKRVQIVCKFDIKHYRLLFIKIYSIDNENSIKLYVVLNC